MNMFNNYGATEKAHLYNKQQYINSCASTQWKFFDFSVILFVTLKCLTHFIKYPSIIITFKSCLTLLC